MALIIWILYAVCSGVIEAIVYHSHTRIDDTTDEHWAYSVQRIIVAIGLFYSDPLLVIAAGLVFPFFHDGAYYEMRRYLNPSIYRAGFLNDLPLGSTAIFSMGIVTRIMLCLVGLLFYITYMHVK